MAPVQHEPRFISIEAAAAIYGVTAKTIRRRIADGTITAHRVGPRLIRVEVDELTAAFALVPTGGHH